MRAGSLLELLSLPLPISAPSASAISIDPPPGFGPDDGSEIYCPCDQNPNPSITQRVMTVIEGSEGVSGAIPHERRIYFVDDPTTLIPTCTESDVPGQLKTSAAVDFEAGTVTDLDTLEVEFVFTPDLGHFGFYIRIEEDAAPVLRSAQATLDGGADTFQSFPLQASPFLRRAVFEIDARVLSLEMVHGACTVVPEPSVALLLGGGLSILAARRRR